MNLQFPLKISLDSISPHSQAILEFFIKNSGHHYFSLTRERALADLHIIDLDYPSSKQQWEKNKDDKPCIALAMKKPTEEGVLWVAKPITAKALIVAAQSIVSENKESTEQRQLPTSEAEKTQRSEEKVQPSKPVELAQQKTATIPQRQDQPESKIDSKAESIKSSATKKEAKRKEKAEREIPQEPEHLINRSHPPFTSAEQAQQRWNLLCGKENNTNNIITYQPNNYFLGSLLAANNLSQRTNQVVQIKYEPHQFYILYNDCLIFSPLTPSEESFTTLCQQEVKPGQINLHLLNTDESNKVKQKITTHREYCNHLEYFIWTTSLLTSQGRLATTIKPKQTYRLKYWPDFTRIESFPFSMKIAALWHDQNYTLQQIAERLEIPINYVTAFADAANSFNLIEKGKATTGTTKQGKKIGIIARLFGKLTNSGT